MYNYNYDQAKSTGCCLHCRILVQAQ